MSGTANVKELPSEACAGAVALRGGQTLLGRLCGKDVQVGKVVRFEDDATVLLVRGQEEPSLYTNVDGVATLLSALQRAIARLKELDAGDVFSSFVRSQQDVAYALAEAWNKCGLYCGVGGHESVGAAAETMEFLVERIQAAVGNPIELGLW